MRRVFGVFIAIIMIITTFEPFAFNHGVSDFTFTAKAVDSATIIDTAVNWAIGIANDDSHGYNQSSRWGPDYDCSSLIMSAYRYAGIPLNKSNSTTNSSSQYWMVPEYERNGFTYMSWSEVGGVANLKKGDIMWRSGHTEMYIGNNKQVGTHQNENGGVTGGRTGDQTGHEIDVQNFYNNNWAGILRYSQNAPISSYTVTLNANGGEVSPTSITVSETYSGLPTPSKSGCAFAGWYTDPNGGENVWNGKALVTNGNHILYAHWKKWYADLTPANLGNSFDAIILNKNCWKPIRPNSSSNVFLYKEEWITGEMWRFTRQSNGSYKIVNFSNGQCLDANGAGTTDGTNVGTYTSNDSNAQRWFIYEINGGYVLRAACGDLAMDLDGNKSADNTNIHLWTYHGGEAQVFSLYHSRGDSVVSDYAKPSPSAPTLSVKSYSSIALSWSATAYTEKYIVYRSTDNSTWKKIGETTSPSYTDTGLTAKTKYYYKFEAVNRFYTVSSPSASATTQEMPTYTVAFNSNGGSGTMSNQTVSRDKATALTANVFKRTGYSFLGWATDKNATKATYTDKQSVTNLAAGGGTVTLYAIWKENTYTIKYDANTGTGTMDASTMTYDKAANLSKNAFTKTGYSFEKWSDGNEHYYAD